MYSMQSEKIKISIICPIYNSEKCIERLLQSIRCQTFRNFEVICILDAPTDGTGSIVREFCHKDNRFKIIENEVNLHVGLSRNRGIELARGEYIGFVDADDECLPYMYETLYDEALKTGADYVISKPTLVYGNHAKTTHLIPR